MKLNKCFIAAMLAAGMAGAVSAQDNRAHSFKNQQDYQVLEEGASSAADHQTKQMVASLGLNSEQAEKVAAINMTHATEVEKAKAECNGDYTGFNQYVDKVSFARDQELRSVLTPDQFASYTNNKSDKTWLGMEKFKFKSEDLKVKEGKNKLKIKGKAPATEEVSASNEQNASPEPDYHNIPINDAMPSGIVVYHGTYDESLDMANNKGDEATSASAKPAKKKSTKSTTTAKKPAPVKKETPENYDSVSSGQTLTPAPNSDDFIDTAASASEDFDTTASAKGNVDEYNTTPKPDVQNYFIDKNSKAKFSEDEIKIKPEKGVKYKITDNEMKLKDDQGKVKTTDHEKKVKTDDVKIKIKE